MADYGLLINFLIAFGLGLLIGLEREYAQLKKGFSTFGGIRTFPLIALFGALAGFLGDKYSSWIVVIAFAAVVVLIIISHHVFAEQKGRIGLTTEFAGLVTFFVGMLSYLEFTLLAIVLAVVMTLLLYEKIELHEFASKLSKEEMYATVKFAIIALVILPILPDKAFGPFDFFNPRTIWFMVVLVSGISFLGYILVKWFGKQGIELGGFLGGFVSSTATALSLSERSVKSKEQNLLVFGVLAANAAMMIKVLFYVFLLNQAVFSRVIFPIGVMIILTGVIVAVLSRKVEADKHELGLKLPFALKPAVKFAVLFAIVLLFTKAAIFYFSDKGAYWVAFLSGLFDADPTALSMLQLANNGLIEVASVAVVLVAVANTVSKGFIGIAFGRKDFGFKVSSLLALIAAVGVVAMYVF